MNMNEKRYAVALADTLGMDKESASLKGVAEGVKAGGKKAIGFLRGLLGGGATAEVGKAAVKGSAGGTAEAIAKAQQGILADAKKISDKIAASKAAPKAASKAAPKVPEKSLLELANEYSAKQAAGGGVTGSVGKKVDGVFNKTKELGSKAWAKTKEGKAWAVQWAKDHPKTALGVGTGVGAGVGVGGTAIVAGSINHHRKKKEAEQ